MMSLSDAEPRNRQKLNNSPCFNYFEKQTSFYKLKYFFTVNVCKCISVNYQLYIAYVISLYLWMLLANGRLVCYFFVTYFAPSLLFLCLTQLLNRPLRRAFMFLKIIFLGCILIVPVSPRME